MRVHVALKVPLGTVFTVGEIPTTPEQLALQLAKHPFLVFDDPSTGRAKVIPSDNVAYVECEPEPAAVKPS